VQRHVLDLGEISDSKRAAWCQTIEAFDENGGIANRSRCFRITAQHLRWTATLCMSAAVACDCVGRDNGAAVRWRAIFGINFN
jgi:hypothetical protein